MRSTERCTTGLTQLCSGLPKAALRLLASAHREPSRLNAVVGTKNAMGGTPRGYAPRTE